MKGVLVCILLKLWSCYCLTKKRLFAFLIAINLTMLLIVPTVSGQCYSCSDTGKIVCENCQGSGKIPISEPIEICEYCRGLGFISPTISKKSGYAQLGDKKVHVSGTFENDQSVGVYGIAIAEVMSETTTFSSESERIYFPPNEEIIVTVPVGDFPINDWNWISKFGNLDTNMYLSDTDSLVCPLCEGDGILTPQVTCSICGGTGFLDCPDCDLNLGGGGNQDGIVIGVVLIIGVGIVAFFLIKRKKTSESDLRTSSYHEFQDWVVQKFSGQTSSVRDSRFGIDGYTNDGDPIQIKQSDDIGKSEVYKFANELSKKKSRRGIIVAFSFREDAIEGIIGARQHYRLEIKTTTIGELLNKKI